MPFNLLTAATYADMEGGIDSLISSFSTIFTASWNMISGNWFLLACIGVPFIGGILFSVVSFFRNR